LSTKIYKWFPVKGAGRTYLILNAVFASIIILIFLYSAVFNVSGGNYPIPSFSKALTGEDSISTGLSRSFSELVRFDFAAAEEYNPYGFRIWIFFVIQLFMRILISLLIIIKPQAKTGYVILPDSIQAVLLFIICFWPFLLYFFNASGVA